MDHNVINGINEAYTEIKEAYTVQGHARIGSTPAKATDKSVSSAVDKALANRGTAVSASSEKGKTGVTGGGSFRMSGSIGGGKSKPKPNPAPTGGSRPKPKPTPAAKPTSAPRVQNPAASPARRVQNPAASTPTRRPSGSSALGGGMSIGRGGGGGGMMRMDTMSDVDTYNLVLEYLLDEGFASTEQSADKIILNMSEAWFEDIVELYKGKHGQSEKEYKEELELDENRRAARSAGGYKDDSKKQPDPSKDGFTGIGNMSIDQIRKMSARIEKEKSKKDVKEGVRDDKTAERKARLEKKRGMKLDDHPEYKKEVKEGREEDAKKSLDAVKKRQEVLDDHEKKTGKKLDITKTPEHKAHKQNFPGAKRTGKKERGAKETDLEKHNRRVQTYIDRLKKHGKTKKQKRDDEAMAKHTSRYD